MRTSPEDFASLTLYFSMSSAVVMLYGLGAFVWVCVDRYWEGKGLGTNFWKLWGGLTVVNLVAYGVFRGDWLLIGEPNYLDQTSGNVFVYLVLFWAVLGMTLAAHLTKPQVRKSVVEPVLAGLSLLALVGWIVADFGLNNLVMILMSSPFALLFAVILNSFALGPAAIAVLSWLRYRDGQHLGAAGWLGMLGFILLPLVTAGIALTKVPIVLLLMGVLILAAPWLIFQNVAQTRVVGVHAKERWWISVVAAVWYVSLLCYGILR